MTTLAHTNDPDASHAAAANLDRKKSALVKQAIIELLAERPRAAFELQSAYMELRGICGWPLVQPHSVNRRLSELHGAGAVRPVLDDHGDQVRIPTKDGATATVWEIVPAEAQAAA